VRSIRAIITRGSSNRSYKSSRASLR